MERITSSSATNSTISTTTSNSITTCRSSNTSLAAGVGYTSFGPVGAANCAPFVALYGDCQGQYGFVNVLDYGSGGQATSNNNAFFVQDSWSIAKGLTINAGLRLEKEYLPAENQPSGGISHPINFGWGDKIAPRIGVAWDPFGNGKMKIFGGYGQFYDQMKLNLAISSFGGQYWSNCYYALDTANVASIAPQFNSNGRYCAASAPIPRAKRTSVAQRLPD